MSSNNDSHNNSHNSNHVHPPKTPRESLLEELESIKGLLNDERGAEFESESEFDLDIDIPILEDVVSLDQPNAADQTDRSGQPALFNLQDIFDEEDDEENTADALPTEQPEPASDFITRQIADEAPSDVEVPDSPPPGFEHQGYEHLDLAHLDTNIEIPSFRLESTAIDADTVDALTSEKTTSEKFGPEKTPTGQTGTEHFAQNSQTATRNTVNVDWLIQEIVDEIIPDIESKLRQRLSQYSPDVILELAEKYLDA